MTAPSSILHKKREYTVCLLIFQDPPDYAFSSNFFHILLLIEKNELFRAAVILKRVSTKNHGSSTTATNAEVMLIQTNTCEVDKHEQLTLFRVWGHKKV